MFRRIAVLLAIFVATVLPAQEDPLSAIRGSAWYPQGAGSTLLTDPQRGNPVGVLTFPHLGADTRSALLGGSGAGVVGDGAVGGTIGVAVPLRRFVWSGAGGFLADDAGSVSRVSTALARPLGSRLSAGASVHGTFAVKNDDLAAGFGMDVGGRYRLGSIGDLSRVELHAALTGLGSGARRADQDAVLAPFTPHVGLRGRLLDSAAVRLEAAVAVRAERFSDFWVSTAALLRFSNGLRAGLGVDMPVDGRTVEFWPGVSLTVAVPMGRGAPGGEHTEFTLMGQPGTDGTVLLAGSFLTEFPSTDLMPAALTVNLTEPESRLVSSGSENGSGAVPGTGLAPVAGREQLVVDVYAEDDRAIGLIEAVLEAPGGDVVRRWSFRPLGSPSIEGSITDRLTSDIALREFGSTIVWDISEAPSDGRYRLRITAEDGTGNRSAAPEIGVLVDRVAPNLELGIDLPAGENGLVLDPGQTAELTISYGDAAVVDVEVVDQAGRPLFRLDAAPGTRSTRTLEAVWSGEDASGEPVPDGVYQIRSRAVDEFGNEAIVLSAPIVVRRSEPVFRLALSDRYFPVASDAQIEIGTDLQMLPGLRDWTVNLYRVGEQDLVHRWAGIDLPPERLVVDSTILAVDGEYFLEGSARYANGSSAFDRTERFMVDRVAPRVSIGLSDVLVGRGRRTELVVFIEDDETARRGRVLVSMHDDPDPMVVREFDRLPEEFRWSLVLPDGSFLVPGLYSVWIEAEDEAGNVSRSSERRFEYVPRLTEPRIEPRLEVFSPNGDGISDLVSYALRGPENVERGEFVVTISDGEQTRRFSGSLPLPQTISWDGRDDFGVPFADGEAEATLEVTLTDGSSVSASAGAVIIDTTPPSLVVERIGGEFVSPDGDGVSDVVRLRLGAVGADAVAAEFLGSEGGPVLGRIEIPISGVSETVTDLVPRSNDGAVLPDGAYSVRISARDAIGNLAVAPPVSFVVDTRPVSGFMRVSVGAVSPNGDGIADSMIIFPEIPDTEGLVSWSMQVRRATESDSPLYERSGIGLPIPEEIVWPISDTALPEDGEYVASFRGTYRHGPVLEFESPVITVDATAPEVSVVVSPQPFSPDGDGRDDTIRIEMTAADSSPLAYWLLEVFDPYGEFFYDVGGRGALPRRVRWDGLARNGERVISAETYPWRLEVADELGNVRIEEGEFDVDILVEPFEGGYRIQIPSITFPPNSAVLIVDPESPQGRQNLDVLGRLVEILGRFPEYSIVVEGHAVNITGTQREQEEELVPLSQSRAEAVMIALRERGVSLRLLSAVGRGGAVPVVPHTDEQNRWKNRRVDFILQR